ncbi:uncharacterized protein [Lepisosteus oculatus]|uniref:uncharacterized protein isoform X1 n=1 Tax=Lepisosteus oculatus TaxID=7918 RepID=UPI0035F524EE
MEILILKGLVSIFLLDLCNSQVTVLEPYSSSEISMTTQVGTAVPDREIETTQESDNNEQDFAPAPTETYLLPQSQAPEIFSLHEEGNKMAGEIREESNDFNEIITPKDELLNPEEIKPMPTLDNSVEEIPVTLLPPLSDEDGNRDILDTTTYDTRNEVVALGLEAWRFGAISAAVLLVLETIVVIVYCLKCKKRRIRRTMAVKMIEDSEAAETIHGESNENTLTGGDVQPNQTASNGSCEVTIPKEKQEIKADILLDSPSRDASL